jgi:hypothetical protein
MPLAKSSTIQVTPTPTVSTSSAEINTSTARLDIGGVPVDIFSAFDVPMTASEKEVAKLKTIADWAKIGTETMGDALLKIRDLRNHLGSPEGMEKSYMKAWKYCTMDLYSQELEKKKLALRRRF